MRNTILAIAAISVLTSLALSQDTRPLPPTTIVGAGFARGAQESIGKVHEDASAANPFFCPPKSCLYYAGDHDTNSPNANALFDFDNPGIGVSDAEVWVGVKPTKNVIVTGTSGNYFTTASNIGINPTPVAIQIGIASVKAAQSYAKPAEMRLRGYGICTGFSNCMNYYCMNYYISKLGKSCRLKKGKVYRQGWPEIKDKSYFNSTSFGVDCQPVNRRGAAAARAAGLDARDFNFADGQTRLGKILEPEMTIPRSISTVGPRALERTARAGYVRHRTTDFKRS
jgi:hypothetical protein